MEMKDDEKEDREDKETKRKWRIISQDREGIKNTWKGEKEQFVRRNMKL